MDLNCIICKDKGLKCILFKKFGLVTHFDRFFHLEPPSFYVDFA
jgi:hypothetical protein